MVATKVNDEPNSACFILLHDIKLALFVVVTLGSHVDFVIL